MKIVSWNVNGFRACIKKGFINFIDHVNADIICLQEIKMYEFQLKEDLRDRLKGYHQYWNSASKKGYSGTLVLSKSEPLSMSCGANGGNDEEGRIITLEYNNFFLVNCYSPQSQRGLYRLDYRLKFDEELKTHLLKLNRNKPVVLCGDLNVAHEEIDLKNPVSNKGNAGFTFEEREKLSKLLEEGFIDTYRFLYPNMEGSYTWWSYRSGVREKNIGWRLDYIIVSEFLKNHLVASNIYCDINASDHCPIGLDIDF